MSHFLRSHNSARVHFEGGCPGSLLLRNPQVYNDARSALAGGGRPCPYCFVHLAQGRDVKGTVIRLEQAGWVERTASQLAGCRTEAHLTDLGWRKLQEAAPGHVGEARRLVVDLLTADELHTLGAAARRIVQIADPRMVDRKRSSGTGA